MSNDTWTYIQERAEIKAIVNAASSVKHLAELRAHYGVKNKVVKRSVQLDKRNRIDALASAAQTAANIGDISAVYKITKEVTNSSPNVEHPVKDIEVRLLLLDEDQMLNYSSFINHYS